MSDVSLSRSPTPVARPRAAPGADDLKEVDAPLPETQSFSLTEWYDVWRDMNNLGRIDDRNLFTLKGHYTDPDTGEWRRARLDPRRHALKPHHVVDQICDIDSIIGIVRGPFPIRDDATLKYFILPSPMHALKETLHIPPVRYKDAEGDFRSAQLHQIPNTRFAEMDSQALIRIFFPLLVGQSNVKDDKMALLYDIAMRPAARECIAEHLRGNWPARYPNEAWRAQNFRVCAGEGQAATGARQHSGREIHGRYVNPWILCVRRIVDDADELAWARGFFFGVELRGTKKREESLHRPPADDNDDDLLDGAHGRKEALERLLPGFDLTAFVPEEWYVDVATTISVARRDAPSGCVFAWDVTHPYILNWATGADITQCRQWMNEGGHYVKDEVAHLGCMAGFRFTNPEGKDTGIYYIQVYSSSKSCSYNLSLPGKSKHTSARTMLLDWNGVRSNHFEPLLDVFKSSSSTHGVTLRIESRVSWSRYRHVHAHIPDDNVRPWLLHVRNTAYWGWMHARLTVIYDVLSRWMQARSIYSPDELEPAISLLVLLTWMANSLLKRPDEGGKWSEVRDAGSVHTKLNGSLVPYRPLNLYYLHSLEMNPGRVPRISSNRVVSAQTLLYLLSMPQEAVDVTRLYAMVVRSQPPPVQKRPLCDPWDEDGEAGSSMAVQERRNNKQKVVHTASAVATPDKFQGLLQEPARVRYPSEERDPEARQLLPTRTQQLTSVVYDFPVQMFKKVPNISGEGSWCRLDAVQLSEVSFDTFRSMDDLKEAFDSYILFPGQPDKWDGAVASLFPTIQEAQTKRQNYSGLGARDKFVVFLSTLTAAEQATTVARVREHVSQQWVWMPGGKGRLWATGDAGLPAYAQTVGRPGGPWIVLNPRLARR
ncbi:hypothetical protein FRC07_003362 [Ceratobasidium sp. 392]|nr:hypothetical protein FRC07_003362 [Ceratobasidium sp. 392]